MYTRYIHVSKEETRKPLIKVDESISHGSYGGLLFDKRWKLRRSEILLKDNNRCVICKEDNELQVHHRQYHFYKALNKFKPPWDYPDQLLITLCNRCHKKGHSKFKVPTIYI